MSDSVIDFSVGDHSPSIQMTSLVLSSEASSGDTHSTTSELGLVDKRIGWKKLINPRWSLRARLALYFGIVALILTAGVITAAIVISTNQLVHENGVLLASSAQASADSMDRSMFERLREISNLATLPVFTQPNASVSDMTDLLNQIQSSYKYYSWIGLARTDGKVIASTQNVLLGFNISARPVFKGGLTGPWVGGLHNAVLLQSIIAANSSETLRFLDFSAPVYYKNTTQLAYVLCSHLNWVWAREMQDQVVASYAKKGKNVEYFIMNAAVNVQLAPTTYVNYPDYVQDLPWLKHFVASEQVSDYTTIHKWLRKANDTHSLVKADLLVGLAQCQGYRNYTALPWTILLTMQQHEAEAPVYSLRNKLIGIAAGFWVFVLIIGWLAASQIVNPLTSTSLVALDLMKLGDNKRYLRGSENKGKVFTKDEVHTLCCSTQMLMHTLEELSRHKNTLEMRVADRTKHLQEEVQRRMALQDVAEGARKVAEAAEEEKTRFMANMSHEIRTPMNGILGTVQLLIETQLTNEQMDYAVTMKHSADSLLSIINDVLLFSKMEAKRLQLQSVLFQVEDLLEGVGDLLGPLVTEKGVGLHFIVHPDVPTHLYGDLGRMRQVMINLIGNSVKFTATGDVYVICSMGCTTCLLRKVLNTSQSSPFSVGGGEHTCCDVYCDMPPVDGKNELRLRFEIRDSGCGIKKEQQGQLFTPFFQADSSTTRIQGGTGLGLSICKQIIELFRGTVQVQSQYQVGTSFTFHGVFSLPPIASLSSRNLLALADPTTSRPMTHGEIRFPRDTRVLCVSDKKSLVKVLTYSLGSVGITMNAMAYTDAQNLVEAIDAEDLSAVLLSLNDSSQLFSTIAYVREHTKQATPIIPLFPMNDNNTRRQLTDAKIRHVMTPLSIPKLLRELLTVLNNREQQNTPASPATQATRSADKAERSASLERLTTLLDSQRASRNNAAKKVNRKNDDAAVAKVNLRILAVEDNHVNLKILNKFLGKLGNMTVMTASDGQEAFDAVTDKPVDFFDLILMDLHMPVMDGMQSTKCIREWEIEQKSEKRLKIIALTADIMPGINEQCEKAGMNGYLSKPINQDELAAVVFETRCAKMKEEAEDAQEKLE